MKTNQKNLEDLCMVLPLQVKLENVEDTFVKPCGLKYNKNTGVYCPKYSSGLCEYVNGDK